MNAQHLREPTADECEAKAFLPDLNMYACWYPQMGGYVSKCLVEITGDCFDVYIWHDGSFPFNSTEVFPKYVATEHVNRIHHCMPEQFINFGTLVKSWIEEKEQHKDA